MPAPLSPTMVRLADAVGTARSLDDIYDAALASVREATGVDRASILLFDSDGAMRFKAWTGISDAYRTAVDGHTPWAPGAPPPDPIVVADVRADDTLTSYLATFEREAIRALAFIPVVSRRTVIGKFMLYKAEPGPFGSALIEAALAIGYQIGFAVDRMRREQEAADNRQQLLLALDTAQLLRERLSHLTSGAPRLLASLAVDSVLNEVLALARSVVAADGYAVWHRAGDDWRIAASAGLSAAFRQQIVHHSPQMQFDGPVIAEDVRHATRLESRRAQYDAEGITSLLSMPLSVRGTPAASIVFYYRTTHRPTDLELYVATTLGQLAAAAISNAELYAAQQRLLRAAEDAEMRSALLAEASALLSSLEYERNLQRVAELVVPRLSDWCAGALDNASGEIARRAATHRDPDRLSAAHEMHRRYPPSLRDDVGIGFVIRTEAPQLLSDVADELPGASARAPEYLRVARDLHLQSVMIVPLTAGRRTFGTLSFATLSGGRRLTSADLQLATELARRAALSIENARLFSEAREANRLKDEFLATLSHELRTPLNVILGRTRRLGEVSGSPDAVRQNAETIERNAQALTRLVEDLLDVSRFTLGQVALTIGVVDLAATVQTVVAGLEPAARAKGITLVSECGADVPSLEGDATRLQQVVWNLLTNAIKFTPVGGRVRVGLERTEDTVELTVSDTGVGIAPEFLPHVFDMFRQGEAGTSREHGGLGLGLSIVRRLAELHGGTVSATSAGSGCGATFRVALPCAAGAAAASAAAEPAAN